MLCDMRTFSLPSHTSQTSALSAISFVRSLESQQYPASGPVFVAMGIDFGRFLTFLRRVFNTVKGAPPCTAMMGDESSAEIVVRVDGIEEGPGMGCWWECDIESAHVDKRHEVDMGQYHTVVEVEI